MIACGDVILRGKITGRVTDPPLQWHMKFPRYTIICKIIDGLRAIRESPLLVFLRKQ